MMIPSFSSCCGATKRLAKTGVRVSAIRIAPPIANAYVCAIGEKMTPDTPVMVKSGRNDADDEGGERHRTRHLARRGEDAVVHGAFSVRAEVAEDVLHHDHGGVDHDAEVDG